MTENQNDISTVGEYVIRTGDSNFEQLLYEEDDWSDWMERPSRELTEQRQRLYDSITSKELFCNCYYDIENTAVRLDYKEEGADNNGNGYNISIRYSENKVDETKDYIDWDQIYLTSVDGKWDEYADVNDNCAVLLKFKTERIDWEYSFDDFNDWREKK